MAHPQENFMAQPKFTNFLMITMSVPIFNIGTATCHLAKYLSKPISPLGISKYTAYSTKDFVQNIQTIKVPTGYHMVSCDWKSLLTNVPLEYILIWY